MALQINYQGNNSVQGDNFLQFRPPTEDEALSILAMIGAARRSFAGVTAVTQGDAFTLLDSLVDPCN